MLCYQPIGWTVAVAAGATAVAVSHPLTKLMHTVKLQIEAGGFYLKFYGMHQLS